MNRYNQWVLLAMVTTGIGLWSIAGASAAEDRDACTMLHKEDVEAAFSPREFDSVQPGFSVKSSPKRAGVTSCTYTARGATTRDTVTVTLGVRSAPSDATGTPPAAAKAGAVQLKTRPVDVSGLGEGAYMVSLGSSIQLNVFRGKREWLIFACRARTLTDDAILLGLTKIAKATLAR